MGFVYTIRRFDAQRVKDIVQKMPRIRCDKIYFDLPTDFTVAGFPLKLCELRIFFRSTAGFSDTAVAVNQQPW